MKLWAECHLMKKGGEVVDVDLRRGLGEALHNYTVGLVHLFLYISPFFSRVHPPLSHECIYDIDPFIPVPQY